MAPPRINRQMGNAQSRQPALGRSPQPGYTTNVNGAHTASRMTLGGKPVAGLPPSQDQFSPQFQMKSNAQASQSLVPFENSYAPLDRIGQQDDYLNPRSQSQRSPAPSAGGNAPSYPPSQYDAGGQVERGPYVNDGQSGQMQYAGGDVAGQAQYYRNTALQQYAPGTSPGHALGGGAPLHQWDYSPQENPVSQFNPSIRPNLPGSSIGQSRSVGAVTQSGASPDVRADQYRQLNGYDTFTAGMNDPNRLTPDQKYQSAIGSGQRMGVYDPTNQGGNRFAGSAARIQAADAYNQAAIAAGTQANQQRMQGIAADSQERAMDPNSQDTAFSYQNAQGEFVNTNRLGQLQEMQSRFPDSNEIALAIAEEKQRGSALGQNQEDQRERRKNASFDGLTDKERRTLRMRNQVANNAGSRGILPTGAPDPNRPGFSVGERLARNNQEASDKSSFRSSETKLRRSAINAENAGNIAKIRDRIAKSDRTVDADGQLNPTIRDAAKSTIKNIADPNYQGSREFKEDQRHVAAFGLKPWAAKDDGWFTTGGDSPSDVVGKVLDKGGIQSLQQAKALRKYWNAQKDSDADWLKKSDQGDGATAFMNEMAAVPESELAHWFEQNRDRLAGSGPSTLAPPANHPVDSAPSYGFGSF